MRPMARCSRHVDPRAIRPRFDTVDASWCYRWQRCQIWSVLPGIRGSYDQRSEGGPRGRPVRIEPSALARGRGDPHHSGGGRGVRAAGAVVLGWQGLHRHAASGAQGVQARAVAVPGDACRYRPQLRRGHRDPRRVGRRTRGALGGRLGPGRYRRRPGRRDHRVRATRSRP